jgi:hypothetical protein
MYVHTYRAKTQQLPRPMSPAAMFPSLIVRAVGRDAVCGPSPGHPESGEQPSRVCHLPILRLPTCLLVHFSRQTTAVPKPKVDLASRCIQPFGRAGLQIGPRATQKRSGPSGLQIAEPRCNGELLCILPAEASAVAAGLRPIGSVRLASVKQGRLNAARIPTTVA